MAIEEYFINEIYMMGYRGSQVTCIQSSTVRPSSDQHLTNKIPVLKSFPSAFDLFLFSSCVFPNMWEQLVCLRESKLKLKLKEGVKYHVRVKTW